MPAQFFEGPEKKVELVVRDGAPSLRSYGDATWERVVAACQAQVLSKASTDVFDAYLLSESSLFVYDEHITMITCGRTRLIDAVDAVLDLVGVEQVPFVALERKNEHQPRLQPTSFAEDARRLAERIPGQALRFGDAHAHRIQLFHSGMPYAPEDTDVTLEVLMHGICARGQEFGGGEGGQARARATGVGEILPGFQIDDYVFEPTGYSLNALRDNLYYTLHITPEDEGSYVSFETNFDFRQDPQGLISRVIEIFQPESFDVFSFVPGGQPLMFELPGYGLRKHVFHELCGYGVTFLELFRPPSGPEAPFSLALE